VAKSASKVAKNGQKWRSKVIKRASNVRQKWRQKWSKVAAVGVSSKKTLVSVIRRIRLFSPFSGRPIYPVSAAFFAPRLTHV
jgi:hypothetical protein